MRRLLAVIISGSIFASCSTNTVLYNWGGRYNSETSRYEHCAYNYYEKQSPQSVCELVCIYASMVENPGGVKKQVPPGIYAEYGYLLLQPETAKAFEEHATNRQRNVFGFSDYGTSFHDLGLAMLRKEIEIYPESAKFLGPLVKKLER